MNIAKRRLKSKLENSNRSVTRFHIRCVGLVSCVLVAVAVPQFALLLGILLGGVLGSFGRYRDAAMRLRPGLVSRLAKYPNNPGRFYGLMIAGLFCLHLVTLVCVLVLTELLLPAWHQAQAFCLCFVAEKLGRLPRKYFILYRYGHPPLDAG